MPSSLQDTLNQLRQILNQAGENKNKGMFDPWTTDVLLKEGIKQRVVPSDVERPYTLMGVPNAQAYTAPDLAGTNVKGFVLGSNLLKNEKQNRGASPAIFLSPTAEQDTVAHEAEHLLARQNAGFPQMTREKFKEILLDKAPMSSSTKLNSFLEGLTKSLPYLKEKYGIANGYMNKDFIKKQGEVGLFEIFATLAAAESTQNVDLTKDPELRKTLFKDQAVREAYNAVTGLRQTRMDAKDLPPYTPIDEPSWWDNALRKVSF